MTAVVVLVAVIGAIGWALVVHAVVNAVLLRRLPDADDRWADINEPVSLLLPMRNEEARAAAAVAGLLAQQGLHDVEVLVLDDESADATALQVLATGGADPRLVLLDGAPLPDGWLGKPHACAQLAARAKGVVLVFVDADVTLAPDAVARSIALLRKTGLSLVSPYPRQLSGSVLERLVQPLLQWSWLTFLPLRIAERSRRRSLSAANGQLLVVDTGAYRRAGGHAAVRGEVVEDVALVRAVKSIGGRGGVVDGTAIASCRMYDGRRALVEGWSKSLGTAFGGPAGGLAVAVLQLALYVLPWVLVALTPWALVAAAAGPAGRVVAAARTGSRPLLAALLHPVSVLVFAALVVLSVQRRRAGTALWRGRPVTTGVRGSGGA